MLRRTRGATGQSASIVADSVTVVYGAGAGPAVLDGVSLQVERGELAQVVGKPGSGKSTLLRCLAALQQPTAGEVFVSGVLTSRLRGRRLAKLSRKQVAPLFEDTALLPSLSVLENLVLPGRLRRSPVVPRQLDAVIETLGLGPTLSRRPDQLSDSENQLARCGRVLLTPTPIIVADEPLRDLSPRQAEAVQGAFIAAALQDGRVVIVSGQKPWESSDDQQVFKLDKGRLSAWGDRQSATPIFKPLKPVAPPAEIELDAPAPEPVPQDLPAEVHAIIKGQAPPATPPRAPSLTPLSDRQREVVELAQQILGSLPGQIAPEDSGASEPESGINAKMETAD